MLERCPLVNALTNQLLVFYPVNTPDYEPDCQRLSLIYIKRSVSYDLPPCLVPRVRVVGMLCELQHINLNFTVEVILLLLQI